MVNICDHKSFSLENKGRREVTDDSSMFDLLRQVWADSSASSHSSWSTVHCPIVVFPGRQYQSRWDLSEQMHPLSPIIPIQDDRRSVFMYRCPGPAGSSNHPSHLFASISQNEGFRATGGLVHCQMDSIKRWSWTARRLIRCRDRAFCILG